MASADPPALDHFVLHTLQNHLLNGVKWDRTVVVRDKIIHAMQVIVREAERSLATLELGIDPIAAIHQALGAIRTLGEKNGEGSPRIQLSMGFEDGDDGITGDEVGGTIALL